MPKNTVKCSLKLKQGFDEDLMTDIMSKLDENVNNVDDIGYFIEISEKLNSILKKYLKVRFDLAQSFSDIYKEAGLKMVEDNNFIIIPIKNYFKEYNLLKNKITTSMFQDKESMVKFKTLYIEFKKSQIFTDGINICSSLDEYYKNIDTTYEICPFKDILHYKSNNINFKLIIGDSELDQENRDNISKLLKD